MHKKNRTYGKYKTYKVSLDWIKEFLLYFDNGYTTVPSNIYTLNLALDSSVDTLVKEYILPNFVEDTMYRKTHIKESLRYGLNFWSDEQFEDLTAHFDMIISIPRDMTIKDLCAKIWEVMFKSDNYLITNTFIYEEVPQNIY